VYYLFSDFLSLVVLACSYSVFIRSLLVKIKCVGIHGVDFSGTSPVPECARFCRLRSKR
jgi:hypothetical protein